MSLYVLLVAMCLLVDVSLGGRMRVDFIEPEPEDDADTSELVPPPEPICCARRKKSNRKLGGGFQPILEYKLKEAGKVCHSKSFVHTNFPIMVTQACCANLQEGAKGVASESPCLENGQDCGEFNAVKQGPMMCVCKAGLKCRQTKLHNDRNEEAYHDECHQGRFSPRQQYLYGLMCMRHDEVTCQQFGAREEKSKAGHCSCDNKDVCIGQKCRKVNGNSDMGFKLSFTQIQGPSRFARWQHKELAGLGVRFHTGCIQLGCDKFGAVGRPDKCRCEPKQFKFGSSPRKPTRDWKGGSFHVQEGWDGGFFCRVQIEDQVQCPYNQFNSVGLHSIGDEEPYCQCNYKEKCDGPHCEKLDGSFFYPSFLASDHYCLRA